MLRKLALTAALVAAFLFAERSPVEAGPLGIAAFQDLAPDVAEMELRLPVLGVSWDAWRHERLAVGGYISPHSVGTKLSLELTPRLRLFGGLGYRFLDSGRNDGIARVLGVERAPGASTYDRSSRFYLATLQDLEADLDQMRFPRLAVGVEAFRLDVFTYDHAHVTAAPGPYLSLESVGLALPVTVWSELDGGLDVKVVGAVGLRFWDPEDVGGLLQWTAGFGVNF